MDGTLVDSEKLWTVSLHDTARWLGGTLSSAARDAVVGGDLPRTLATIFDDLGLPHDGERMAAAARFLNDRTAELFADGLSWRPGAQEALRLLDGLGWPTALVTNTERALTELALDTIGREFFTVTVCGDEVPRGSPTPTRTCGPRSCSRWTRPGAWRWRTRRPGRWPPSGPAPRCSSCRARCRCPPAPAGDTATRCSG